MKTTINLEGEEMTASEILLVREGLDIVKVLWFSGFEKDYPKTPELMKELQEANVKVTKWY